MNSGCRRHKPAPHGFPTKRVALALLHRYRPSERRLCFHRSLTGTTNDHEDIRGPMPLAIDRAIAFIDRNTRHPMKVVGLNRIRLKERDSPAAGAKKTLG